MGLFDITPQLAPLRNYAGETRKTLDAQVKMAPALYQANEIYQPLYNSLNLQNVNDFLLGTEDTTYDTYAWTPGGYRTRKGGGGGFLESLAPPGSPESFGFNPGSFMPGGDILGGLFGDDGPKRRKLPGKWTKSGTATREGQRGFLDIYQNEITPAMAEAQSKQRAADIADVAKLGPEARAALRLADPEAANLLDQLYAQSSGDLGLGTNLNASEERLLQQSARAGQAARGLGFGPRDAFDEALTSLNYGRGLQNDRRAFAANTLGQLEHFYGDPFQAILGRSSQAGAQNLGNTAVGASRIGSQFNPESSYAADLYNTNFNAQQSVNNASASNNAAILSGIISSIGSMAGGASSMI